MDLPTGTVTFLFTDIEGSTNLARTLGSRWPGVLEEHHGILRKAIRDAGGIEVRTEGDAFFAVFRSPVDAIRAAATAQREIAAHPWPDDGPIRVRMGMHTGEGRLAGDDYIGLDVHRAARIAAAAHGGQVLASESTRTLAAEAPLNGAGLRSLGTHRLKDFDEPQFIYQLDIHGLPSQFPPPKTLELPTNLPVQLTTFVGRDRELTAINGLLGRTRLVTLTGPGGSGKTRLAIEVARRAIESFGDGVYFVDLSAIRDPRLVPSAILISLGRKEQPDRSTLDTVKRHLVDRQCLLLLDNFEQVVEAADVVQSVLEAAPTTKILVTSRIRLDVPGEHESPVPPLEVPSSDADVSRLSTNEAVKLFVERAEAVRPSFEVTEENAGAVGEICARLEGLPLAIELAAAQVRLLSPRELLARLEGRLSSLATGSRNVPERQRTLRNTIEWSYDLLEPAERKLFARLGVFAGGGTLAAAEAICNPEVDLGIETLDGLASLIDKSLVRHAEFPEGSRFTMLETIREYARDRLDTEFDADATEGRHAGYFAADAEERGPHVRGERSPLVLPAMVRDLDNYRAAVSWSLRMDRGDVGLRLGAALWRFFVETGGLAEAREALESLLTLPSSSPRDRARAAGIVALGSLLYWQADYAASKQSYNEALELFREIGDKPGEAEALIDLAYVTLAQSDPDSALAMIEQGRGVVGSTEDQVRLGELAGLLGIARFQRGEYEEALISLRESLERFEEARAPYWAYETRARIGSVYRMQGRLDEAEDQLRMALAGYGELAGLLNAGAVALQFAAAAAGRGDYQRALRLGGFAEAVFDRVGGRPPTALMQVPDVRAMAAGHVDDAAVDRFWNEGKAMTTEQIVRYAMREENV